jgi:nitric oxide reductase NorD protein
VLRAFLARRRGRRLLAASTQPPAAEGAQLADVRRRLELVVSALYGRHIPITPAVPGRGWGRTTAPTAANDGERILLPATLQGGGDALARYRLMAVEQAERIARGTAGLAPPPREALERDLYLLIEGAAVDAAITERMPRLAAGIAVERAAERARRAREPRGAANRRVEALVRELLEAEPATPPPALAGCGTPASSLRRARELATEIRAAGRYRGILPVAHWGSLLPAAEGAAPDALPSDDPMQFSAPQDADANARSAPMSDAAPAPSSEDGTENPDAPEGQPDAEPAEGHKGASASGHSSTKPDETPEQAGGENYVYPEWDVRAGGYRTPGAVVRIHPFSEADGTWSRGVLETHAAVARRIRQQFERLRARRVTIPRQTRGDDLDLAACVRMLSELRAGHGGDDRLYASVLPRRREVAILLLVDISGSTSETVGSDRIVDVEKRAVLLTGEALDALGDPYAVLAFSGRTSDNVRIRRIKGFAERNGDAVRCRVDALEPEGFTRLGAAVRHATAALVAQPAGRRLLLILSDGKPYDDDAYEGRYAVEDSRQAIIEARARGVHPFCLTVDAEGGTYLPRIFGSTGHVILNRVDQLPRALLAVIREIFRR